MNKNREVISCAIALIIKSAIVAARFSGRIRKRSLKRLAAMDISEKDKEILFLMFIDGCTKSKMTNRLVFQPTKHRRIL
jgi:hypothetical protein